MSEVTEHTELLCGMVNKKLNELSNEFTELYNSKVKGNFDISLKDYLVYANQTVKGHVNNRLTSRRG